MGAIAGVRMRQMCQDARIAELERKLAATEQELVVANAEKERAVLRAAATERLREGGMLTRPEVAAYLGVSTRKVQRMDEAGTLPRCPNMGSVVRYSARDVLRLASAPKGKES